ncbi:MAG: type 2 isopentenyl-diphosphate Delta-isomerase [Thermoproteota archaeon]|nr:MAG: type 2 isopentenyl-diphosphate Delta-isomerase [Candidatus Korarchaeota archaeon]
MKTSERKLNHLMIAKEKDVEPKEWNWFDDIILLHSAASEISPEDVKLSVDFLGKEISAPIIIEGMTGGHEKAREINVALAEAAREVSIPLGLGSQRAALEDPSLSSTFRAARDAAPDIPIIANLGASHIIGASGVENASKAISMVEADALAVHLNLLQEIIQPEGSSSFKGLLDALTNLVDQLDVPVIVKEIGVGISKETAALLEATGIAGIDVAGLGGTNWAIIEGYRSQEGSLMRSLARTFETWGIPTPASIIEAVSATEKAFIIGSGGVRSGLDASKCIILGAEYSGAALPFLRAYYDGGKLAVLRLLNKFVIEMKTTLALSGASNLAQFRRRKRYLLKGRLLDWVLSRGLMKRVPQNTENF